MKIYNVIHVYDVDGGFGDPVSQEEVVFSTTNKEKAHKWVDKWSHPYIYDTPYGSLYCCGFYVKEVDIRDDIDEDEDPLSLGASIETSVNEDDVSKEISKRLVKNGHLVHSALVEMSDHFNSND